LKNFFFLYGVFLFVVPPIPVLSQGNDKTIPLLISEHHADHMEYFFRCGVGTSAAMILLDAHADTGYNKNSKLIRASVSSGDLSNIGSLAGNHNWIHPLAPSPLGSLIWVNTIAKSSSDSNQNNSANSTLIWGKDAIGTVAISLKDLSSLEISSATLFISIDLDFFYSENISENDIPEVFGTLFSISSQWLESGSVVWAICLSRPWLPDVSYAWLLLEKALFWLCSRSEFHDIEIIDLFDSNRIDTSNLARAYSVKGMKMPVLHEADTPESIKELIRELLERN